MSDLIKRGDQTTSSVGPKRQQPYSAAVDSGESDAGFDVRQLLMTLWRRKFVILLVTVAIVIPVAIATYLATPLYRSNLLLEIAPEPARVLPYRDVTDLLTGGQDYELHMKTQDQILRGSSLRGRVQARLHQDPVWAADPTKRKLTKPLEVVRLLNSHLFALGYTSPDPEYSAAVVNLFAEEYIKQHFEAKQATRAKAMEFLDRELSGLKQRIEISENEFVRYGHANKLEPNQVSVIQQKLAFLSQQVSNLETDMISSKTRFEALRAASLEKFPPKLLSTNILSLESKLLSLEQEMGVLSSKYDERWPGIIRKREEIELAKQQLTREKLAALEQARLDAEVEYRTTERKYQMVAGSLGEQEELMRKVNEASIQFNNLKREVETSQELYNGLMERLKQTSVTAGLEFGNIHIAEPGEPNYRVYSPRMEWNLALGTLLGLALGVCLAFILDLLDRSLTSVEQAEELLAIPALGAVPVIDRLIENRARRLLLGKKQKEDLAVTNGNGHHGAKANGLPPAASEAFRTICASILLSDSLPARTILVTSAVPGEGKTTFVVQLAKSFAESGARTVILELDLRKPMLSTRLALEPSPGLSLFLSGHVDAATSPLVRATDTPNLFVISSGPRPPNPIALLNSTKLEKLLEKLVTEFRFVLLDSPPVLTVADARVLSPKVQGVVLVAQANKTPRDLINRARNQVESAGGKILGLALNRAYSSSDRHYRYYQDETYYRG